MASSEQSISVRRAGALEGFRQKMIKEDDTSEDALARAKQLTEALRGLLKEELRKHGGAEAFVRWIRSDKDAT